MAYRIALADESHTEAVLALYHSLIGTDGCTWDLAYPHREDIRRDVEQRSLYILLEGGELLGAAAAGRDDELDGLDCFDQEVKAPCVLARLAVKAERQNQGIAKYLIRHIEAQAPARGFDGIRLLVSQTNPHAKAVYDGMGYACQGACAMYGRAWYCYEKKWTGPHSPRKEVPHDL